jgi:hypothetical protein
MIIILHCLFNVWCLVFFKYHDLINSLFLLDSVQHLMVLSIHKAQTSLDLM